MVIKRQEAKIKELQGVITKYHNQLREISNRPSTAGEKPAGNPNILPQVSSVSVPDQGGSVKPQIRYTRAHLPNLSIEQSTQGNPVTNRVSEVRKLANEALSTLIRTVFPQGAAHSVGRHSTATVKGKMLTYFATDSTDEVAGSDDESDESVIPTLGKRGRAAGHRKGTDAKRDSQSDSPGEEAERPNKNRVSGGVSSCRHSNKLHF